MKTVKRKTDKGLKAACIFLVILILLAALDGSLLFANILSERSAHAAPSYERTDIVSALKKTDRTDEDYELLYLQTGLSRKGIERLENNCLLQTEFVQSVLEFQDAFFTEYTHRHEIVSPVTTRDILAVEQDGKTEFVYAPMALLETGDVIVSSVCHSFGWRHGHSALVVDAENSLVLESVTVGANSTVSKSGMLWFRESANFMVLRLKDEYRAEVDPAEVAVQALNDLSNIPYSLTLGIFHKKDQGTKPKYTHCSHLVWQAYKNFGIDIDSNGGALVSSRDIARSKYFEVVQVFGFDPVKLW